MTSLLFGNNFVALKVGLEHAGPLTVQAWSTLLAGAALALLMVRSGEPLPRGRATWAAAGGVGLCLTVGSSLLMVYGVRFVTAGLAALLVSSAPIFTLVLSAPALHQRGSATAWAGALVGLAGVGLISVGAAERGGGVGVVLLLAAAALWALGLIATKRFAGGADGIAFVTLQTLLGVPMLFAAAVLVEGLEARWAPALVLALAYSGVASKGLGSLLQYRVTAWSTPAQSSLAAFLVPAVALVTGALVLGETARPAQLLGGAVVLVGVVLVRRGE